MSKRLGLILAGGKSLRLYPTQTPKPLLPVGKKLLLQEAVERLRSFETRIISNREISKSIEKSFRARALKKPAFFVEPEGRDTAAAVGFGLREAKKLNPDWVAILSADQWMPESANFNKFLKVVEAEVKRHPNALFVSGSPQATKPREKHSQFGWIVPLVDQNEISHKVSRFVEKPTGQILEEMRNSGALINAGMFFGNYKTFLKAFEQHYPDVLDKRKKYSDLPRQPVDKAIFEKFSNVRVFPFSMAWEDLGTWEDWFRFGPASCKTAAGTKVLKSKTKIRSSSPSKPKKILISTPHFKEVTVFGISDLAVIEEGDRLLIMPLSESQNLKKYLEESSS